MTQRSFDFAAGAVRDRTLVRVQLRADLVPPAKRARARQTSRFRCADPMAGLGLGPADRLLVEAVLALPLTAAVEWVTA